MNQAEKMRRRQYWHGLKGYLWENRLRGSNAIARDLGEDGERVRRWMVKFGIPRTENGQVMTGAGNHQWKGGRTVDRQGYVLLKSPGHPFANRLGYVREHRLVLEKLLGRYLGPKEVVHHKDGDHANNCPDNLVLYRTNGDHLKDELQGKSPKWTDEGSVNIDLARHQCRPERARENMRQAARLRRSRPRSPDGQFVSNRNVLGNGGLP